MKIEKGSFNAGKVALALIAMYLLPTLLCIFLRIQPTGDFRAEYLGSYEMKYSTLPNALDVRYWPSIYLVAFYELTGYRTAKKPGLN